MSSVDLHTHSGFQRVLPESFAVVCAPNSIPKYAFPACMPSIADCLLDLCIASEYSA